MTGVFRSKTESGVPGVGTRNISLREPPCRRDRDIQQIGRMNRPQPMAPPADASPLDPTCCIVCGGVYEESRLPGLFRCAGCGLVSADLRIPDAELAALYGEHYFYGEEYLDSVAEQSSLRLNFRKRIRTLQALRPDLAAADVFEVGCAYGFFISEIARFVHS